MIEKYTLVVFKTAMLTTAGLAILFIWFGPDSSFALIAFVRPILITFVIGLASFILWAIAVFYRLAEPVIQALLGVAKR